MKQLLLMCIAFYGAFSLSAMDVQSPKVTRCAIRAQICETFTKLQSFYDVEIKPLSSNEKTRLAQICSFKSMQINIDKEKHDHLMNYLKTKIPEDLSQYQFSAHGLLINNHRADLGNFMFFQGALPSLDEYEESLKASQQLSELEKMCDDKFRNIVHKLEALITSTKTFFREKIWSKMAALITLESQYDECENQKCELQRSLSASITIPALVSVILDYQLPRPIFDRKAMDESPLTIFKKDNTKNTIIQKSEASKKHIFDGCPDGYKKYEKPWEGQQEFLYRLKKMELACPPERIMHTDPCSCITSQCGRGIAIFTDQKNHYTWMYGFSEFVQQYNIKPSEEFYDYVMNYPLDEVYRADLHNKSRTAYSADGKYIATA